MKCLAIKLLVGVVSVLLTVGTLWGADEETPANEPAVDSQQAPPELPSQAPASPTPSRQETPAAETPGRETPPPDTVSAPAAPTESPADPCKGCVCSGGMVSPACLECCR
ncbi:MAG: hypothetical protein CXR31_11345 [Geobacter sp.]|nr:MAG: hypothetical protein CXR31_11345 [Geobacter sp.]